jgi:hypothetical protein
MQPHIQIYFESFGYTVADTILCEVCGAVSVDIHHIIPRSKFGKKRKDEQDKITNLIALCRNCHVKAHENKLTKEYLQSITEKR